MWIPTSHRIKSNSKWNKDLENIATIFVTLVGLSSGFLGMTPKNKSKREKHRQIELARFFFWMCLKEHYQESEKNKLHNERKYAGVTYLIRDLFPEYANITTQQYEDNPI